MSQYFYGEDTYQAREAIGEIATKENATIRWLGREELLERPLTEWAGQRQSLFGTELLVATDPSKLPKVLQAAVLEAVSTHPALNVILWEREIPDKRSALFRHCRKDARQFTYRTDAAIVAWLTEIARQKGGTLELTVGQALLTRLGKDGWRLQSELEKLLLQSEKVTLAQVTEDTAFAEPTDIFAMLDTLMTGDRGQALRRLEDLLQQGHGALYALSMLGYQFRTLLIIDHYRGRSPEKIAAATKLHPFVVEKGLRHIRYLPTTWLLDTLTRILATDFAIKQGKIEAKTALILLLWHIADQVKSRHATTTLARATLKETVS